MQDLLTRFPWLRIPPSWVPWIAVAGLCVALSLAVILVLVSGWGKDEHAPRLAVLNPSSAQDPSVASARDEAAAPKPERGSSVPPLRDDALRIISWDLSTLPAMAGGRAEQSSRTSWRTSFGSERSTPPETLTGGSRYDLKADVVLLQGISDATLLRRFFFPARDWHLIVSRQKLTETAMRADPASALAGITGIAIRVRDGLRITAREYFPRIGGEMPGEAGSSLLAGTAVRIADRSRRFWLASFAVPAGCAEASAQCTARARLAEWQNSKHHQGEAVVIGGMLAASDAEAVTAGERCDRQTLKTDLDGSRLPAVPAEDLAGPGSGCALAMDLPK